MAVLLDLHSAFQSGDCIHAISVCHDGHSVFYAHSGSANNRRAGTSNGLSGDDEANRAT